MQPTLPTATKTIISFIEKGMTDPEFAPVHLTAKISSVGAHSAQTDLVRNKESMWNGRTYKSRMEGLTSSYPSVNLSLFPWSLPEHTTVSAIRDGSLLKEMQKQLDLALSALPFTMRPLDGATTPWRKLLSGEQRKYLYFSLFRDGGPPEWLTGFDKFRMSGSWRIFLPSPSPHLELVESLLNYEQQALNLAQLKAAPPIPIASREFELDLLEGQIRTKLRKVVMNKDA